MAAESLLAPATTEVAHDEVAPDEVALHPRDVKFDFRQAPLHWIPGDPYGSHFVTSLNLFLPAGERWFCKVFTDALEYVKDERLREEMLGFMGQEAVHAKSHDQAILQYLIRHGIDPQPFLGQVEWLFARLSERIDQAGPANRRGAVEGGAALIGGIEHFTAVLGHWVLNCAWDELDVDPTLADLFRWHGAEEVEHRHVAHDIITYFNVRYVRRALTSAAGGIVFILLILRGTKYLVRHDPSLPRVGYLRLLWKLHVAGKRGSVPSLGFLIRSVFRLFKPGYNTETEGNTAQAVAYLATSPAARAVHG